MSHGLGLVPNKIITSQNVGEGGGYVLPTCLSFLLADLGEIAIKAKLLLTAKSIDVFKQRLDTELSSRECKLNWDATDHATAAGH